MTREEFVVFGGRLRALAEQFGATMTEGRILAYTEALDDVPLDDLLRSMRGASRASRFFPSAAELRNFAGWGTPDVGQVTALLTAYFDTAPPRRPLPPFVRAVAARVGGMFAVEHMVAGMRLTAIRDVLPQLGPEWVAKGLGRPLPPEVAALLLPTPEDDQGGKR